MRRLSPADYSLLLDCFHELHGASDLAALRVWLLERGLPRLIPADWFSYNEMDLRTPAQIALLRPEDETVHRLVPTLAAYAHEHPLIARGPQRGDMSVHKISDFVSRAEFHRLGIYSEVYRTIGVEHQIAATIQASRDHVTAIVLSRRQRDFDERDRAILQHLQPQLIHAFRNLLAARDSLRDAADSAAALEALGSGLLVVNSSGRVLRGNAAARARVAAYFGACINDVLPEPVRNWLEEQLGSEHLLEKPRIPLVRSSVRGTLSVRLTPSSHSREWLLVLREKPVPDWNARLRPLGLSRRENEVVRWLLEGKTNSEIGRILGISARTVQKHLEHVFARLGVETRTAAVARVLERLGSRGRFPRSRR